MCRRRGSTACVTSAGCILRRRPGCGASRPCSPSRSSWPPRRRQQCSGTCAARTAPASASCAWARCRASVPAPHHAATDELHEASVRSSPRPPRGRRELCAHERKTGPSPQAPTQSSPRKPRNERSLLARSPSTPVDQQTRGTNRSLATNTKRISARTAQSFSETGLFNRGPAARSGAAEPSELGLGFDDGTFTGNNERRRFPRRK